MKPNETEKLQRVGGFFFLLLLGVGIVLPFVISLIMTIAASASDGTPFRTDFFLIMGIIFMFILWIVLLMLIAWGDFTSIFVKRTAKNIDSLPYHFNSSFKSRGGMLFIDVENGMIAFISSYNPQQIQVFNATRIENPRTLASMMTGVRFVFYLDGKKITMWTLLSNRMVSLKSGVGAEAVSKADTFVELLLAAKNRAHMGAAQ